MNVGTHHISIDFSFIKRNIEFSRVQDLFLRLNNFITSVISQKVTLLIDGNVGKIFQYQGKG
jgi:hypothetical protein